MTRTLSPDVQPLLPMDTAALSDSLNDATLPAPSVINAVDDTLPGTGVAIVRVPDGVQLAYNDILTIHFVGNPGDGTASDNHTMFPIDFYFREQNIVANSGRSVDIYYSIKRASGEFEPDSEHYTLSVTDVVNLPAPGRGFPPGALPVDAPSAIVVVPALARLQPNDVVTMHWIGNEGDGTIHVAHTVTDSEAGIPLDMVIPASAIISNPNRWIDVYYSVQRASGSSQPDSLHIDVSVSEPAVDLPAPTVLEAVDDTLPSGSMAHVNISIAAQIRYDDLITVHWVGEPGDGTVHLTHTVTGSDLGHPVIVSIPQAAIVANAGRSVDISYSITRHSGVTQPDSPHYELSVSV